MNKKWTILGVAVAGLAVLIFGFAYYKWQNNPQHLAQNYIDEIQKKYQEDVYGGDTPEETLQLFINALKNGDIFFQQDKELFK
jgi:hypothetical protein